MQKRSPGSYSVSFTAVSNFGVKKTGVFVTFSLITDLLARLDGTTQSGAPSTWASSSIGLKYWTRVELANTNTPRANVIKLFTAVSYELA